MDNSVNMCDEYIESYDEEADAEAKSNDESRSYDETNFNENKVACKMQNFYILLPFLLIIVVFLIAVSIYCYLIKYRAK